MYRAASRDGLEVCRLLGMRVDSGLFAKCGLVNMTPFERALDEGHLGVSTLLGTSQGRIQVRDIPPLRVMLPSGCAFIFPGSFHHILHLPAFL